MKKCEHCGVRFIAYRDWDKYCSNACGMTVRMTRYWLKKIRDRKEMSMKTKEAT